MPRTLFWVCLGALGALACGKSKPPSPAAPSAMPSATERPSLPPVQPPKGLPPIPAPADNPITAAKVALGWQLFFDPRLSASGALSCNSCHHVAAEDAAPPPRVSQILRDVPALTNVGYKRRLFWDGRATSLEQAVQSEWSTALGADPKVRATALGAIAGYRAEFAGAFPGITVETVSRAIATALRSYVCADTPFDRHQGGEADAMTAEQLLGWQLFQEKARCIGCHAPPFFSDAYGPSAPAEGAHNTGVGILERGAVPLDPGIGGVTHADADVGRFVTPSLRDVTRTAPYFHDGSAHSTSAAVIFMARGGTDSPRRDKLLADRGLTPSELQAIVDFLPALECATHVVRPSLPPASTPGVAPGH